MTADPWTDYMRKNKAANWAYRLIRAAEEAPQRAPALRKPRPKCGTETAYKSHRRHNEDACRACKSAHSVYCQRTKEQK